MMKLYAILSAVILLTTLSACRTETVLEESQTQPKLTLNASLPDDNNTRAHITYGYGDPDNREKENFVWADKDYMFVFNISRLSECPWGIQLETTTEKIHGKTAIFESIEGYDKSHNFSVKKGDLIFVSLGETLRKLIDKTTFDERNIFTTSLGSQSNKVQIIELDPDKDNTLAYMRENLRMYDIVTAEEDGKLPDIHFKHLSAIFRVTLRNETGVDLFPTKLDIEYPTTSPTASESDIVDYNPSFLNTTLYCSVETDANGDYYLQPYDTTEFYGSSQPYTQTVSTCINMKEGTQDAGEKILNGTSYELYLTAVPRLGNDSFGKELTVSLIVSHDTDHPYQITIKGFNKVIEAGKRYWFDLVATPDNKLVFKSQYKPEDYQSEN